MGFEQIKNYALSLPEVTEEPHFKLSSYRVRGKIFVTVPPDQKSINIFVDEIDRERAAAIDPISYEKLWWGANVVGLKVHFARADSALVIELVKLSWQRKAPNRLKKIYV